ncbi:hypothetical protein [Limosilactobacillus antri]|uniref:hypothetical protein n=1 Tax=Limosilactobacillus antri TaxID=227943 RepID=UPI001F585506|nr:hypothetical protein [Limosilactobacillus antri]
MKRDLLRHKLITIDDQKEVGSARPFLILKQAMPAAFLIPRFAYPLISKVTLI